MRVTLPRKIRDAVSEAWRNRQPLPERDPILVYSMRKVGSTTVTRTLRDAGHAVYKQHCVDTQLNEAFRAALSEAGLARQHWVEDGAAFGKRLEKWRHRIERGDRGGRLKVFTFVKDPLAIALSDYFMHLNELFPEIRSSRGLTGVVDLARYFRSLVQGIVQDSRADPVSDYLCLLMNMPAYWFDREIRHVLGIDVLERPFDVDKGYGIYAGRDADLALIRTDRLSVVAADAITDLLGERVKLQVENVGVAKRGGLEYRELLGSTRLPRPLLDAFYSQPWLGHFFAQGEIAAFKARWSGSP